MARSARSAARAERVRPTADGILTAADAAFAKRGYAAIPLRDLIAACGCSTTAFYARFDSKEAVLEALIRRLFEDLHGTAAEALPRARSIEDGCAMGIDLLCSTLRGRKGLWRLVLTEGAHTPRTRPLVRDAYAALAALLQSQLDAASRAGRIPRGDSHGRAWAIVGTLSMHLTRWAVFEEITEEKLHQALLGTARLLLPSG